MTLPMKSFRSWLKWMIHGRAALGGLRNELQAGIGLLKENSAAHGARIEMLERDRVMLTKRTTEMDARLSLIERQQSLIDFHASQVKIEQSKIARELAQEKPKPVAARNWREFVAQVEGEQDGV